jgi:hypothetical protein
MTTFRSEEGLVGLLSLAIVPWIGWTILRGLREGRLLIGRGHLVRAERPAAFGLLLALYLGGAAMLAFIGVDLLAGD